MTGEPVKQLALGLVRCEVADQGAFGCVFPELFYLRQIILHRRHKIGSVGIWLTITQNRAPSAPRQLPPGCGGVLVSHRRLIQWG